jgi:CRISPR-associated protein Cas1
MMATLYLDRRGLEACVDEETISLYESGALQRRLPLQMINRLVISAPLSISTTLLLRCVARDIAVIVFDPHHPSGQALLVRGPSSDGRRRIAQYRAYLDPSWRSRWSARVLEAKLRAQVRFLTAARTERPDQSKPLFDSAAVIDGIIGTLSSSPPLMLGSLLGMEGAAAAAFFAGYAALFAPALAFSRRNRRPPRDPVNVGLSLGYTLTHAEAVRATITAGLDPYVGFYHDLQHGRESLACDFVEPERATVEAWVWQMFRDRVLRPEHFHFHGGRCLIGKAGRRAFYENFEPVLIRISRRHRRRCQFLLRALQPDLSSSATNETPLH